MPPLWRRVFLSFTVFAGTQIVPSLAVVERARETKKQRRGHGRDFDWDAFVRHPPIDLAPVSAPVPPPLPMFQADFTPDDGFITACRLKLDKARHREAQALVDAWLARFEQGQILELVVQHFQSKNEKPNWERVLAELDHPFKEDKANRLLRYYRFRRKFPGAAHVRLHWDMFKTDESVKDLRAAIGRLDESIQRLWYSQ